MGQTPFNRHISDLDNIDKNINLIEVNEHVWEALTPNPMTSLEIP